MKWFHRGSMGVLEGLRVQGLARFCESCIVLKRFRVFCYGEWGRW